MAESPKIPLRGWEVWVNTGTVSVPVWTQVKGIRSPALTFDFTMQDSSTYDGGDAGSDGSTQYKWRLNIQGLEIFTGEYVRDPGQVFMKSKGRLIGPESEVQLRFYRSDPDEGFTGTAEVKWQGTGGEKTQFTPFNVECFGQGELDDYTPA